LRGRISDRSVSSYIPILFHSYLQSFICRLSGSSSRTAVACRYRKRRQRKSRTACREGGSVIGQYHPTSLSSFIPTFHFSICRPSIAEMPLGCHTSMHRTLCTSTMPSVSSDDTRIILGGIRWGRERRIRGIPMRMSVKVDSPGLGSRSRSPCAVLVVVDHTRPEFSLTSLPSTNSRASRVT
jgi:hypothetical protein